jgi:Fuc2NAc and GlcNAc transferase
MSGPMLDFGLPLLVCGFVAAGTGWVRRHAPALQLLDVPNDRSSHTRPTPRGGGLALATGCLLAWSLLAVLGVVPFGTVLPLCLGAAMVAGIGFLDDIRDVPAALRMLVHLLAAAIVSWAVGGLPSLELNGITVPLGAFGYLIAILGVAWALNLFNFMDGIDGIAASESATAAFGAAGLLWLGGATGLALLCTVLGAASVGFLVWNWPPAKIFMGDVGSGFLGFVLAALALCSHAAGALDIWAWLVLLGVFVVDATFTLLRRLLRRQRVYQAHRSHAYQHAASRYGSHAVVTRAVLAINVLWLLPIAAAVATGFVDGALAVAVAYLPLVGLAVYFRAGTD